MKILTQNPVAKTKISKVTEDKDKSTECQTPAFAEKLGNPFEENKSLRELFNPVGDP